jgi:hypothetical protein
MKLVISSKPGRDSDREILYHQFYLTFVADMLSILINRAKEEGQFDGIIPHLVDGGLSILQYADDTVLFLDHDLDKAKSLKLLLCAFEQLSGLKINFHKSEIFCFGMLKTLD